MPARHEDFIVDAFTPVYLSQSDDESLAHRARTAMASLHQCRVCPRTCGVDRLAGEMKICHTGRWARVTSAFAHMGEEDCLRGTAGSGTIFFGRCNLHCVFCQNWDISQTDEGRECRPEALARIMLQLQEQGCHNINLVTPEHVVPQVIESLVLAIRDGLCIPIVYNTSAYDSQESLCQLDGLIDIYMPDFKLWSSCKCARLLGAKDYGERARAAIAEMHRQVGDLHFTRDGLACRGLMIRHLVMPGLLDETANIVTWLAEEISPHTGINIMGQYRPAYQVGTTDARASHEPPVRYADINRRPTRHEIDEAFMLARQAGLWRFL
jgi:putative pyruvate formate lyase activating enzyme